MVGDSDDLRVCGHTCGRGCRAGAAAAHLALGVGRPGHQPRGPGRRRTLAAQPAAGSKLGNAAAVRRPSTSVAVTIDDGPDPDVTPQVLSQLAEYRAHRHFFLRGRTGRALPGAGEGNCGSRSRHRESQPTASAQFLVAGPERNERRNIARPGQHLESQRHRAAFFSRACGVAQSFLDPILARLHLRLASWTRRGFDTVHRDADAVYQRLATPLQGGDILLLHDGNAARARSGRAGHRRSAAPAAGRHG